VIIDLTGIRDGTGPARLLDMVEGRSKAAFKTWLADRPRPGVTLSRSSRWTGSPGSRPPPARNYPTRSPSWIPFTSFAWPGTPWTPAGAGSNKTHGHRGRKATRSTGPGGPCTPALTCSPTQQAERLTALFTPDEHVEVEATWGIYQRMIAAYRHEDRATGRELMVKLIESVSTGVPAALVEVTTLGRTLKKRAADVLAYFDRPGTSNGPTEASTAASNTYAAPPSGSATSPTTSPDACGGGHLPWNFPLMMASWKIAPAIAWGNTCIIRPSEDTPASVTLLGRLAIEAGVPPGVLNVLNGHGTPAGSALTGDERVDRVTFTGSSTTGKHVMASAAAHLAPVSLELGGKGANIVFADAELDNAVYWAVDAIFRNAGQICLAGSRLFIHTSIFMTSSWPAS
jgi:hypothetical protein